jgi:hypothetical protein
MFTCLCFAQLLTLRLITNALSLILMKSICFQGLPFAKVAHQVNTTDSQPSNENGGILVMVTGILLVREVIEYQGDAKLIIL